MSSDRSPIELLEETSRTFAIPIARLSGDLRDAVGSAYLCLRAIDEIEDHPDLSSAAKAQILRGMSFALQGADASQDELSESTFAAAFAGHEHALPEVSLRLAEWSSMPRRDIAPRIWDCTAAMADRMAFWVERDFRVRTKSDLDAYTFSVAGAVGLLLSDLWSWHDGIETDRVESVGFGRGLQAVNIVRNHDEDAERGVVFFPDGWERDDVDAYARHNLGLGDAYCRRLPSGPIREFCEIPLTLAHATLDAIAAGREKLTRSDVNDLVSTVVSE